MVDLSVKRQAEFRAGLARPWRGVWVLIILLSSEMQLKGFKHEMCMVSQDTKSALASVCSGFTFNYKGKIIIKLEKGKNKESLLRDGFKVTIKGKNELEKYEIETENTKCI